MHQETDEYINPVDQYKPDDLYAEMPIDPSPQHRYSTRSKGPAEKPAPYKDGRTWVNTTISKSLKRLKKAIFHASLTIKQKNKFGVYTNMTVRQAIDKYGDKARKAVTDELQQLIKLKVLKFVKAHEIDPIVLKSRLPSKTFVKIKFDAAGLFEKIKARLVGGGHKQKRYLYSESETSSPTISLVGLYIVALIAADEGRTVITADVAGAYPELEEYLDSRGKLTAECLKALYGLIESGRLWFELLSSTLIANGYVQNQYEPCIFNKWHEDEQVQSTIGIYVDDIIVTCKNADIAEAIITSLESEFDELTITRGKIHKFTGMIFDFTESRKLKITMKKSIDEILKRNNVTSTAVTPSTEELFQIDETSPYLVSDDSSA
mmetsp:Transcript_16943/g.24540  ORF Transcript_16943/g.24540 Transcript_16943/m.24540 type:complete len:377 (-) Transcript_16943:2251-3381(-)